MRCARRYHLLWCGPAVVALLGCSGEISPAPADPGGAVPGETLPETEVEQPSEWEPGLGGDPNAASKLPLRLITSFEYNNTIALIFRDTFGVINRDLDAARVLQGESIDTSGFLAVGEMSEVSVLRYMDAARSVAEAVAPSLSDLMGCDLASSPDEDGCVRSFVTRFGELLFRRPLEASEIDGEVAFYRNERDTLGSSPEQSALQLLQGMLTSPYFLYRWELGHQVAAQDGNVVRLNPFQVASRLAFFLWGSGPDENLIALAKSGGLATDEQVRAQAQQMLDSPRAELSLGSFHRQWLGLDKLGGLFKDEARFPEWGPELRQAMQDEIEAFTRHVILDDDSTVSSLLSAPYSFLNEPLAQVYGVSGVSGSDLRRVDLNAGERAGLLTMPGLLAAASDPSVANPFKRGKLLLEKVLCQKLEPPPVVPPLPSVEDNADKPVRQTLEELTAVNPCAACHSRINPLGFGLGNYDAIGVYQTEDEAGFAIDASGTLPDGGSFSGPSELGQALAENEDVRVCLAKQWFRFSTGREETKADDYALETAYTGFESAGFSIRDLMLSLVSARSFLYRTIDEGEVIQ